MASTYHLVLRPIAPYCYPEPNGMTWEFGEYHFPPIRREWGNDYGTIIYSQPLSFHDIWRKDMRPADPIELAKYKFWLYMDRNFERADEHMDDYMSAGREELAMLAEGRYDSMAEQALILLNAGAEPKIDAESKREA